MSAAIDEQVNARSDDGASSDIVAEASAIITSYDSDLSQRFRALFTLRNFPKDVRSVQAVLAAMKDDPSSLFKHECAYCLGQMHAIAAVEELIALLKDGSENAMVRHEAGEALAILLKDTSVLEQFVDDSDVLVRETCRLAICRVKKSLADQDGGKRSMFNTDDPAFPHRSKDVGHLVSMIKNDENYPEGKYEALFGLRDLAANGDRLALERLCDCIEDSDPLFRHELAFVFGQIRQSDCISALERMIDNQDEHYVVRHEAAFSLGSIATEKCLSILRRYLDDPNRVVRESALIGLDMADYEKDGDSLNFLRKPS